jgi:TonB family protein
MALPAKKLTERLDQLDPASAEFRRALPNTLGPRLSSVQPVAGDELGLWRDVFVQQPLPWGRFLQSALLHTIAFGLIWGLSISWLRQQRILASSPFDRSSVITYSPEEYLPPLDTGSAEAPRAQTGDPAFAKQPILSVPRESDNRSQTIVVPPDLKLDHDLPLPNIVATGAIVPAVPIDATRSLSRRAVAPDAQVVAPAPDAEFARDPLNRTAIESDVIPPPPDVRHDRVRGITGPETAVVEPPPELKTPTTRGHVGPINIGLSQVVAPAPALTLAEQHTAGSRGGGAKDGLAGGVQPVAPPPSAAASGGGGQGRMIALGLSPIVPTGPVAVPAGNRRGTFSASPQGKPGASGTPSFAGSKSASNGTGGSANPGNGFKGHGSGSLPAGLHVGAVPGTTGPMERSGRSNGSGNGDGNDNDREMASLSSTKTTPANSNSRTASAVSDDKITDLDRQVFGDRRPYAMTLNMPNLNSTTGSWVIRFAELQPGRRQGVLLAPEPTEKSDPGYPLELIRTNVHGMVTLYAVIHSDGQVGDIRVLNSPDDRLDAYAARALARWKFQPAEKGGKPVAIEAVVVIPFRVRRTF